jgi:hypothetical protein
LSLNGNCVDGKARSNVNLKESPLKAFLSVLRSPVLWIAILLPAALSAQPVIIAKTFGAASIAVGGSTSLSFQINNNDEGVQHTAINFTDTLPAGLVVSTPDGLTGTCGGGIITATAGSGFVSLSGTTLDGGGGCVFSVNITATSAGVKNNSATVFYSTEVAGGSTSASITVIVPNPPTISKAFGAANIPAGGTTSLSFSIANPNIGVPLSGVGFVDAFPAGLAVATPNGLTGSCGGGTITATAASGSVSLSGATLGADSSCTFSVNVTGATLGTKINTTSPVASNEGGAGGTATASIIVQDPPPPPTPATGVPVLSPASLAGLALLLAGLGWTLARRASAHS